MLRSACASIVGVACAFAALSAAGRSVRAEAAGWHTDFEAAKAQAKADHRLLLIFFTGSDWSGPSNLLKQKVFDQAIFVTEAPKRFVLAEVDLPRWKKQPENLATQNKALIERYHVPLALPVVILADDEGNVVARRRGLIEGGPKEYLQLLESLVNLDHAFVETKKNAETAHGFDRAKLLDRLVDTSAKLENHMEETPNWSQGGHRGLDSDNKLGLKSKYEFRAAIGEVVSLYGESRFDDAKAKLQQALALPKLAAPQQQQGYELEAACCYVLKDFAGVGACLDKALATSTEEQRAAPVRSSIELLKKIVKQRAALDAAKGLDRVKILYELGTAENDLHMALCHSTTDAQEMHERFQEIIDLDPDNKAGLMAAQEFKVLVEEACDQINNTNLAEGRVLLEKALTLPGLAKAQIAKANEYLGVSYNVDNNFEKGVEYLKKALSAVDADDPLAASESNHYRDLVTRAQQQLDKQRASNQK